MGILAVNSSSIADGAMIAIESVLKIWEMIIHQVEHIYFNGDFVKTSKCGVK